MSLVNNYVLECEFSQDRVVSREGFVVGEEYVELWNAAFDHFTVSAGVGTVKFVLLTHLSSFLLSLVIVQQTVEVCPGFDLSSPLLQSSQGSQNEKRS